MLPVVIRNTGCLHLVGRMTRFAPDVLSFTCPVSPIVTPIYLNMTVSYPVSATSPGPGLRDMCCIHHAIPCSQSSIHLSLHPHQFMSRSLHSAGRAMCPFSATSTSRYTSIIPLSVSSTVQTHGCSSLFFCSIRSLAHLFLSLVIASRNDSLLFRYDSPGILPMHLHGIFLVWRSLSMRIVLRTQPMMWGRARPKVPSSSLGRLRIRNDSAVSCLPLNRAASDNRVRECPFPLLLSRYVRLTNQQAPRSLARASVLSRQRPA
ncbi:hypothetical protein OBBRIDRAFT_135213 [Obba rivulosa]|uniref:Uncharacterized protein n=1 Tax=Obba rivulosa TaxID=1052685 RepID=A0A8E2DJC5_9APHY|nr:hypothetical protein OBBRIDRAFT_135213 [Obba rivulosa]